MSRDTLGSESSGPAFWRSEDERRGASSRTWEVPHRVGPLPEGVDRRRFLQVMGASLGLAGLTGCTRQPLEEIVPYVSQPEEILPGRPLYFASAFTLGGYALGTLVESHMGRPTKVEGNPDHPASLGATDLFAQASVLSLYDPDRSQSVQNLTRIRTVGSAMSALASAAQSQLASGGAGLAILTETVTSPTVGRLMGMLRELFPSFRWVQWDPAGGHAERAGTRAAFGDWRSVRYDFRRARAILTLDADPMASGPGWVRYAREIADGRRLAGTGGQGTMSRIWAVESSPSAIGSLADHRLRLSPAAIERFVLALAAEVGVPGVQASHDPPAGELLEAVAAELAGHRGESVVVPGPWLSPEAHVLVHAINGHLENLGRTVEIAPPVELEPQDQVAGIGDLARALSAGEVSTFISLGSNPVYTAPAELDFAAALLSEGVRQRFHHGLYFDETAAYCHWHLPATHGLEAWGDARAFDGTATILQPLIEPLYGGRSELEVLAALGGELEAKGKDLVQETWAGRLPGDPERAWRKALHDGIVPDTRIEAGTAAVDPAAVSSAAATVAGRAVGSGLELALRPDPTVHDGRFANNAWLQECPKPFSRLTWDNAALISPATARALGLESEQVVRLELEGRSLEVPVWVLPGQADDTVTLHLGYGRTGAGVVGNGCGVDAYRIRTAAGLGGAPGLALSPTGATEALACTQAHQVMEGRHLVRGGTLEELHADPHFVDHFEHGPRGISLYPTVEYEGHAWGMAVDLGACTGCNACVVACQSENNVPTVGKNEVIVGREMHWIRIDRYFEGPADDPHRLVHQPIMCQHCEGAPCELVCPVGATVHSDEGLNDMVYNRCVGTRYCANNCPYKVRRFNFFKYADFDTPVLELLRNPDVTVRHRGVMEKCSYCVQRINHARIAAKREERRVRDGEVVTACQQVCPTQAITFGDINDPESRVAEHRGDGLSYQLLTELNTRPRTSYLARISNPAPGLAGGAEPASGAEHG